jgi:hypothetical protein
MKADILHGSDNTEKIRDALIHHGGTETNEKSFFTTETRKCGDNKEIARIAGTLTADLRG